MTPTPTVVKIHIFFISMNPSVRFKTCSVGSKVRISSYFTVFKNCPKYEKMHFSPHWAGMRKSFRIETPLLQFFPIPDCF